MLYIVVKRIFMLKNFENHEFLNGQNFSKIADVIFAINVPNENLSDFNINAYKIISKNAEFTGLKLKKLTHPLFCSSKFSVENAGAFLHALDWVFVLIETL